MLEKPSKSFVRWGSIAALILASCVTIRATQPPTTPMPRAQRHESRHEIDQLEQSWRDALINRNVAAMQALLADDYISISANGTLQSKEQTLANLRTGGLHFKTMEFSDRKVRFYGNTALVTSRAEVSGSGADGDLSGSYRYTRVYVRDDHGAWKVVSFEASRIRDVEEHK
jgi:ketosteroid isomerase-like protein